MFTMKHSMRPKYGESSEFARQIGSYQFKEKGNYVQFLAFDDVRGDGTPDVWGGWKNGDHIKNPYVGMIYIMNDAGSTVANYRYIADMDDLDEIWPEPASPPICEQQLPEAD